MTQVQFADLDPTFPGRRQPLSQADFARLLRADPGNICRAFDAAGIDVTADWRDQLAALWAYRSEQAAGRRGDGPLDLAQERANLARQQADKTAFELRRLRGEFIPKSLVVETLSYDHAIMRTNVLSLHSKIASRFPSMDRKIVFAIEEEARAVLTNLVQNRLPPELCKKMAEWEVTGNEPEPDGPKAKPDGPARAPAPKAPKTDSAPRANRRDPRDRKSNARRIQTAAPATEPQI